jgi:hypothetical protein
MHQWSGAWRRPFCSASFSSACPLPKAGCNTPGLATRPAGEVQAAPDLAYARTDMTVTGRQSPDSATCNIGFPEQPGCMIDEKPATFPCSSAPVTMNVRILARSQGNVAADGAADCPAMIMAALLAANNILLAGRRPGRTDRGPNRQNAARCRNLSLC